MPERATKEYTPFSNRSGGLELKVNGVDDRLGPSPFCQQDEIALLTGGGDKPYALGIALALSAHRVPIDFIGSDDLDVPELQCIPSLNFLNLRGDSASNAGLLRKVIRILVYYCRL